MQISKLWECEATDAQNFFLSEKKLLNAILRAKLKHMKNVSFYEMNFFCNAEDRFSWVWAFCRKSHFRAEMHKLTSLELLRTPILCFSANKQIMRMRGHRCSKTSFSWEKVAKCNFKSKAQAHEKCFFLMKWTVFCNAEDRFSCVWAFLQKKSF